MDTQIFKVNSTDPDQDIVSQAAAMLKSGGLVAFPTETVYGLGADGLSGAAVKKIYTAKGRPSDNPLILHISSLAELPDLAQEIPEKAWQLAHRFWPGPLTLVLKKQTYIPDEVTGGLDTVGIRLPGHAVARRLIALAGTPLAAPSANLSGRPSPTTAQMVLDDLDGRIEAVIDGGSCAVGLESTVVDCTSHLPIVLRPGGVTVEQLREVVGDVLTDPALENSGIAPKSPGMKYAHYAPDAPVTLIEGQAHAVRRKLIELAEAAKQAGKRVGLLLAGEPAQVPLENVEAVRWLGSPDKPEQVAVGLYSHIRAFNTYQLDAIFAEGIPESGMGDAVMNRLRKAAGGRIIRL